jgi:hypothetical protein
VSGFGGGGTPMPFTAIFQPSLLVSRMRQDWISGVVQRPPFVIAWLAGWLAFGSERGGGTSSSSK